MTNFGFGFGYGVGASSSSGEAAPPTALEDYAYGIEATSFVDPGGGGDHRECEDGTGCTNLADSGYLLSPHFTPNVPILHSADWTWDNETVIPHPGGSEDFFSVNFNNDTTFSYKTEFEQDCDTGPAAQPSISFLAGLYVDSSQSAAWVAHVYGSSSTRIAFNTGTGRIDAVTPSATVTNLVTSDSTWGTNGWHMFIASLSTGYFKASFDGVECTYGSAPTNLGGNWTFANLFWGTWVRGGQAFLHVYENNYSLEELHPVATYLSNKHGVPYTYTPAA